MLNETARATECCNAPKYLCYRLARFLCLRVALDLGFDAAAFETVRFGAAGFETMGLGITGAGPGSRLSITTTRAEALAATICADTKIISPVLNARSVHAANGFTSRRNGLADGFI